MITVTTAKVKSMAKLTSSEQQLLMEENPNTNFGAMVLKCEELAEELERDGKGEQAVKLDDLKFLARLYEAKQKHPNAVEIQ